MRFQKILMLVTVIIAALCFVFAVSFLTGGLGNVRYYITRSGSSTVDKINATDFYNASQSFVTAAVVLAIVFIIASALLYLFACNSRRNYYITNYIIIGVVAVVGAVIAVYYLINISVVMNYFYNGIAWKTGTNGGNNYADMMNENYPVDKSPLMFILGYVVCILVMCDVAAQILNLIWKIKLMKGEKELLEKGLSKEVA